MKRLVLVSLFLIVTPQIGRAQNQNDQGQNYPTTRRHISATEMGAMGAGTALLIGLGGYLLVRRRKSA